MKYHHLFISGCMCGLLAACSPHSAKVAEWVTTTYDSPWETRTENKYLTSQADSMVIIDPTQTDQTIEGFGSCFNEKGWESLSKLNPADRDSIFKELYTPAGGNFTIGRMPLGANDFSLDWYSYDETDKDFEMKDFSVSHDEQTLIPFIQAALAYNPNLKLWASPWCPPSWMKVNKHYACSASIVWTRRMKSPQNKPAEEKINANPLRFRMHPVENNLSEDKQIKEGTDGFIQDEAYLKAYALYFGKFIDAYKEHGINISMVMPQNEPNSAQPYPSCCWTYKGLSNFIKYLGPEMNKRNVEIYAGTVERPNPALVDTLLTDSVCSTYIKGCGFQWAGKDALPAIRNKYPHLSYYQTEQECGNGLNNWEGAMHSWDLMRYYLENGVNTYMYWNTSLMEGGVSRWGWCQNSLITVNDSTKTFTYTPEYYILKHVSHYVQPTAKRIKTGGNYTNVLAFINEGGSIPVITANPSDKEYAISLMVNNEPITVNLPARSINTLLIKP